jgi:hypothetical protein
MQNTQTITQTKPQIIGLYAGKLETKGQTINALFTIEESKIKTSQNIFSTTMQNQNVFSGQDIIFKQEIKSQTKQETKQEQEIKQEQEQEQEIKQEHRHRHRQEQIPETIFSIQSKTKTKSIFKPLTITKTKTPTFPIIKPSSTPNQKSYGLGYNVFVRSKGVFQKINPQPLTKNAAIGLGSYRVGNTAAATFKIEPTQQKATGTSGVFGNLQNFYTKGNLFIERPSKRIKSTGELNEITFKGIRAKKSKSIFNNVFSNNKNKKIFFGG